MSHALTLMHDFFLPVDRCEKLLSPRGIIGVVDFFVANVSDIAGRDYTAGFQGRHTNTVTRAFFILTAGTDRIGVDSARRDYLEYRFGNIVSLSTWARHPHPSPYYAWIGCKKDGVSETCCSVIAESSSISGTLQQARRQNETLGLPLPSYFYQRRPWRLPYDEYRSADLSTNQTVIPELVPDIRSYAIEMASVLRISPGNTLLTYRASSDAIIAYCAHKPKHLIAVDPSPPQNHLLELKLAACCAGLKQRDLESLFETRAPDEFRKLLVEDLSVHLTGRALSWWMHQAGKRPNGWIAWMERVGWATERAPILGAR